MKKFELTFNPYTKESRLVVGGKPDKKRKEAICGQDGTDLTLWAADFFPRAVDSFNDAVEVTFNGIERDYEFLEDALKAFPEKGSQLKPGTISKPEDRLQKLRALFAKMQKETPFEVLKSTEQKGLFTEATDSTYEMAVVATMSAGKSTIINSMLGREILPARCEATTARVARIHDIAGKLVFSAEAYDVDHKLLERIEPLDLQAMNRLNDMVEALQVDIKGEIPWIESKDISLILTDTPGPNNSQAPEHSKQTTDLLMAEWKPMILYVLNAKALGVTDDSTLLNEVVKAVNAGGRQSHDRFLFIFNQADELESEKGETVARKLDDAKAYLENHGILNPRIMPTSARLAKLIRQDRNGDALTSKEKKILIMDSSDFMEDTRKHFTDYAQFLSTATEAALKARVEQAKADNNESELALLYSGIPSVEMAISEYLMKYAVPDKIARGVATFKKKIDSLRIEADTINAIAVDEEKLRMLKLAIERLQAILAKGDMARKVKGKIASLSVDGATSKVLADSSSQMMEYLAKATKGFTESMRLDSAKAKLKNLEGEINMIQASFVSTTEHTIGRLLRDFANRCIQQYEQYVKDIMGEVSFPFPADIVLPSDPMDIVENLDNYSESKREWVGSHQEPNERPSGRGDGKPSRNAAFARWLGIKSWFGTPAYVTVDEYEWRKYFSFGKYLEEYLRPKIEAFAQSTRQMAFSHVQKEVEEFKERFLAHLKNLEKEIKQKADELQAALTDEIKRKKKLEENKRNLKWLKGFISELDSILAI